MGNELYPGVSEIAAARMARIAGSFLEMEEQQLAFINQLRAARLKGSGVKAIKESSNGKDSKGIEDGEGAAEARRERGGSESAGQEGVADETS